MDKEKVITKIMLETIFGTEDLSKVSLPVSENVKENFEMVLGILENFEKIKAKLLSRFFQDLKDKVEKELPIKEHGFTVFRIGTQLESPDCGCDKSPPCGGLYISKPEWFENNKDREIYSIAVEKWGEFFIGIVRNETFKTNVENEIIKILQSLNYKTNSWFIGYIPLESDPYFNFNHKDDKEFYLEKLLSDYDNLLEKTFSYIKKIYEDLTGNENLLKLFEESVKEKLNKQKERKEQLSSDGET